jgi:hypothetical protein
MNLMRKTLDKFYQKYYKEISHEGYVSHEWGTDVAFFMALDKHAKEKKPISEIHRQGGSKR